MLRFRRSIYYSYGFFFARIFPVPTQPPPPRNLTVDILRVIAILAVVLIHTTSRTLETTHFALNSAPWPLFLNQISRFAVPLFFLMSGFVLELSYPPVFNFLVYLKKRFNRLLIPYVFWSAVYYFFIYKQHAVTYLRSLLSGDASYQLYFIPSLLILYLIFPVIHRLYRFLSQIAVLVILGVVQIVLLHNEYNLNHLGFFYPVSIALLNFYVFLLGVVASRHWDYLVGIISRRKYFFLSAAVILAGYVFWEGRTRYFQTYNYQFFYSQWRPSVMLYTLALAAALAYVFERIRLSVSLVDTLSRLSYFVFFIHVAVLEFIWSHAGLWLYQNTRVGLTPPLWFDPLFFISVSAISFLTAYIAHKIPLLSRLTG
jgi:surface polysaccharide O-acyltransferase-like enzyme